MKYKVVRDSQKASFKPFSVTLTFETKEEYVDFHDNVMSKITHNRSHDFHAAVYKAGSGLLDYASGEI